MLNTTCFLKVQVNVGVMVLLVGKHQVYLPEAAPCSQSGFLRSDLGTPEHSTQLLLEDSVCVCVFNLFTSSDSGVRLSGLQPKHKNIYNPLKMIDYVDHRIKCVMLDQMPA